MSTKTNRLPAGRVILQIRKYPLQSYFSFIKEFCFKILVLQTVHFLFKTISNTRHVTHSDCVLIWSQQYSCLNSKARTHLLRPLANLLGHSPHYCWPTPANFCSYIWLSVIFIITSKGTWNGRLRCWKLVGVGHTEQLIQITCNNINLCASLDLLYNFVVLVEG